MMCGTDDRPLETSRQLIGNNKHSGKRLSSATHCNTLQYTATHCNTLQHTATDCNNKHSDKRLSTQTQTQMIVHSKQSTATIVRFRFSAVVEDIGLQHTATHCNTLQHTAIHFNTLQHTATRKLQQLFNLFIMIVNKKHPNKTLSTKHANTNHRQLNTVKQN